MTKIHGSGLMWIPAWGKAVQFEGGVILTDDPVVIDCAKLNGFVVESDGVAEKPAELFTESKEPPKVEKRAYNKVNSRSNR